MQDVTVLDVDEAVRLAGAKGDLAATPAKAAHLQDLGQAHLRLGTEARGGYGIGIRNGIAVWLAHRIDICCCN